MLRSSVDGLGAVLFYYQTSHRVWTLADMAHNDVKLSRRTLQATTLLFHVMPKPVFGPFLPGEGIMNN